MFNNSHGYISQLNPAVSIRSHFLLLHVIFHVSLSLPLFNTLDTVTVILPQSKGHDQKSH